MSKASKGIFSELTAADNSTEYYIGGQFYLAQSAARQASLVSPLAASEGTAGTSGLVGPVSASEASEDTITAFDLGEKVEPFGLPDIADEKLLLMMAQDSVNGRLGLLHGADSNFVTDLPIDDEPASLPIAIGGTVTGVIDFAGDTDDLTVNLVAGTRYMISVRGTGATALGDSVVQIFDPSMVSVGTDDDGGNGTNSLITITAGATGTYTIRTSAFSTGTGQYTVDVRQMGTDSVSSNTNALTPFINQGDTFGFRETSTGSALASNAQDVDSYRVHLEAGKFYTFSVAGGADNLTNPNNVPIGEIDTVLLLINPAGTAIVASNDDVRFPSDLSSSFGFFAQTTGDYFLQVRGYGQGNGAGGIPALVGRNTGGYVINWSEVDTSTLGSPLDAINWNSAANIPTTMVDGVPTAYIYFAVAGENFGENARAGDPTQPASGPNGTLVSFGWTEYEKAQFMLAMQEYTKILGINYVETPNSAQATFRVITNSSLAYGAYAYPQDPAYGTQKGIMVFNVDNRGWNLDDPNPAVTIDGLGKGGYAWSTILHEAGHAHGLSHPHDTGGGSVVMAGVAAAQGSLGVFNLNQGVYTQMSYNGGWVTHPDGALSGFDPAGFRSDSGWEATLAAFDIAKLQARYGVAPAAATGDTVYTLPEANGEGTYWETIYDTGGNDTIAYNGARGAQIDLTAATLDYSVTGGGVVSFVHNLPGETTAQAIKGGFTIANGVVIENATGGSGNDVLIGNESGNVLTGNGGNDAFMGRGGNDTMVGGLGTDTAHYDGVRSHYTVAPIVTDGIITGYTVTDVFPANAAPVNDEGTDALGGVETIQFTDGPMSLTGPVLLYDGGGALVGTYATIQAAIDAGSNGYTVWASAGTYNETVNLNKDITLEGPNAGISGTGTRTGEAIVNGIYVSANGATVDGLEVLNGTMVAGNPAGILVIANDVTLTNLVLQGQGTPQMAAVLTGYNTNNTGLVLSDSLVTGWAWGTYFNPSLSFTVTGNSFTGNGNDILGDGWVAGSIDNNSFNDSAGSHIGYGTYLSVEDMRDFVGTNNVFTGTGRPVGIFAYGDGTPGGQDITGTEYADGFFGDEFIANSGNDATFHGLGGNDYAFGAGGNDTFDGGSGIDTAAYDGTATIAETATGWTVTTTTDGTDTLENVEIVDDGAPGVTRLVGNGGYASIQAAIDASSNGDIIIVASGTWTENLAVNKDVTILGVNNHGVDGNAARGDESVIDGQIIVTAAGATLDGFKLIGDQVGSYGNTAVEVQASNFTLANNIMDGDGDVAILVFAGTTGLDVGHNRIEGYSIGAVVGGGTTAGSIHDNRFQGDGGPISGIGNGINTESSALAIANNVFDGIYSGTINITPFGPDTVDLQTFITGNTITNTPVARPVQIMPSNFTHNILGTGHNESFDGETAAAVYGVTGAFSFDGRGGDDKAWGGEQGDTLAGGSGIDELNGNGGDDNLSGGDGDDTLNGGAGADTADGGNNNDIVNGDSGDDALAGGAGVDTLNGGLDNDSLDGGSGNDTLNGNGGNDTMHGGAGNDILNGGTGTDSAVYDGNRGDYSVAVVTGAGGRVVAFDSVADNEPSNGNEGFDDLDSVEVLVFANRTLDATKAVQLFDQAGQLLATFDKIQDAIDAAQDNYTIRVAAGVFDEDLVIDKGVRILGARQFTNANATPPARDPADGVGETTIIGHAKITAEDNVSLVGLRFLNDGTTTGGGPSNPTVQILTGGGTQGHLISNSIFWSTVAGGANGVDDRAISAPLIADGKITLTNNLISGASQGLFTTASWGRGVWLDGGGVSLEATGNTVEWTRSGLVLDGAGGSFYFLADNVLRNLGTAFSIATTEDGLALNNNHFTNVGDEYNFRNLSEDVFFDAGSVGGTVTPVGNFTDAVVILGGSGNDTLTGTEGVDYIDANNRPGNLTVADTDTLNGAGGNDILFGRFGDDTLSGGTGEDSLDGGDGSDNLNGDDDNDTLAGGAGDDSLTGGAGDDSLDGGSGVDTAVVGSGATYTPTGTGWTVTSSDGTDTLTNVEIVDSGPGPNTLLVGSGGFATIQAAVDAANDGDTILVAAGTYVEQVIVEGLDNLTIVAADGAQVTIKAPADLVETARSSSDREVHAVLTAKDSLNLTLQNIDIDGDGRGNTVDEGSGAGQANFYGVFYRNSSGSLLGVDITGVRDPYPGGTAAGGEPLVSGVQRGVGLVVDNDSLLAFSMIGGSISDFQKNATSFNRADLNIAGVTITGGGAQTVNAQNGIQVSNSTGTIAANTITGIGYAGPSNVYSGAILAFSNTNLNIVGNAITGANIDSTAAKVVGVYVLQSGGPSSGGSITGNSISHIDEGIVVVGDVTPDGILIESNGISDIDGTNNDPVGVYFEPDPSFATVHDVDGSDGDDLLSGGAGNDSLSGLDGNDILTGEGGDDTLDGGGDEDVAVYHGPRSGYTVTAVTDSGGRVTGFSAVDDVDSGNGDEGTDTLIGIEKLQFGNVLLDLADPVQLFDGSNQLVGTFDTIQAAVNAAASGYTIRVAAGTYAETVTVDEDVTILGPNAGVAGSGSRAAEAIIDGGVHMNAAGATLDGLTILGGGTLAGNPAGIYVDVDNVTLANLIIEGDGTITPGILTPYGGGVTGLVLSRSLVTGWGQGTYFNPTTGFTASDNSFDGNGNALVGDDWDDATLISGNSFTNSVGSHIGYGVLDTVDDVGAYFGAGNTFGGTNRPTSIFAYGDGTPAAQTVYGTELSNLMRGETAGENYNFHGRGGDDRLVGNNGNDTLDGGTGNDTMIGGAGVDTVILADSTFSISPAADADPSTPGNQPGWTVTTASEGTDSISGIEIIDTGAPGKILLVGNGGFTTIQAAIDAASDGDTIFVAPGTYAENLLIHVGVTILGAQWGEAVAGRDASGGGGETNIVGHAHVTAVANVTLDGLRFLNDGSTTGGGASNPTLQFLTGGGATGHLVSNSIFWSTVAGGANGVDDRAISTVVISDGLITISDNLISGTSQGQFGTASWGRGIWFDGGGVDLVVSGNAVQWSRTGINLDMSGDSTAEISDNAFRGLGSGISVGVDAVGLTIADNDHQQVGSDFSFRNLTTGVTFDAADAIDTLTPADTANDVVAVLGGSGDDSLAGTAGSDLLDGNNGPNQASNDSDVLTGRGGNDILLGRGGTDTAVFADSITAANLTAVADGDPVTPGSQPGWTVTTATEGTDTLAGVEIVDGAGAGNILLVGSGGFTTIQAAIDAANDGDTILVAAGTYVEQLTIGDFEGLTLMAVSGATVIVKAPAALAVNATSETFGDPVRAVIAVSDSTDVTISGIDVDGSFAGDTSPGSNGDELTGIGYFNSSGSIADVDIDNVGNSQGGGLFGLQHGSGLFIDGGSTPDLDVSVTDSSITDFQKTGAIVYGVTINFTGNTITGIGGTGLTAQNGLQIANSEGVVDGNTISGFGYSGPLFSSTGIIAYEPTGPLAITDNVITGAGAAGSAVGLDLSDVEGVQVVVTGNSFNHLDFGIAAYSFLGGTTGLDTDPDISGNTFSNIAILGVYFAPEESVVDDFSTTENFEESGSQFDDYLAGSLGDDSFSGLAGDDILTGNGGDDTLNGGSDFDVAVYSGPSEGYAVTGTTDASGRVISLTSVTDTDPGNGDEGTDTLIDVEGILFGDNVIDLDDPVQLFDANDNIVGTFDTIQAAIDAASDDYTIRVAAGTYDEDLTIDVGVTILGAEAGEAVAGRDAAGGTGETTIVGHAHVTASDNVTLDGLRFLNDGTTTGGGSANPTLMFQTGGGATGHLVTNSIFWSTVAGGANGVDDRAISTQVLADGLITITDNLISGTSQGQFTTASWGRGIWFDGGGVDLVVTGNTIEWSRTGLNLDMSGDSTANVSDNSFRGLGTGIAVGVDSDGLTVGSNDLERVGTDFSFRNLTTNVTFNAGAAIGVLTTVGDLNDLVVVLGGSGNDNLTGTAGADLLDGNNSPTNPGAADTDVLTGLGGNDTLFGRGGNDTLDGGTGDDAMTGGTGNDIYVVDTAGDSVTEAAGEGTDEVRTTLAAYTLAAALENLTGLGNVNQILTGNSSDNFIDGGLGADAMTGGTGNDTYVVDNVGDTVTENASEGTDEVRTDLLIYFLGNNVENLTGTGFNQELFGNGLSNVITSLGGFDTLDGGAGADTMSGGAGSDAYIVDSAGDVVIELADEGNDQVRTGLATYVLAANVEILTATSNVNHDFRGNSGNNVITGGTGNDLLRLYDGGDDTVIGGDGLDNIFFGAALTAADVVNGGGGVDTLIVQGHYAGGLTLSPNVTQIENVTILAGSNTNLGEPGTNRYDYVLTTHDSNFAAGVQARINGAALLEGEDFTFNGSAETNASFVVYGGKGVDTLTGGFGNDIFIYPEERFAPGDTVNGGPAGYDSIFFRGNYTIDFNAPGYSGLMTSIESMTLTSITDERYARGGDPAGFDYNITLADNQLLAGVELTVSGVLLQSYETMIVDGSLETDGTFRFFAGKANDILKGGAKNDLLLGNLGADVLSGGGGGDIFRYDSTADSNSASRDHILDFTPGTDKIDLSRVDAKTSVAGDQAFTWIGSNAFSGSGAASAGQLRAFQSGGFWFVEGDTNGDGAADLSIQLTLQGPTPLSQTDFFL